MRPLPCASFWAVECKCAYCARRRRSGALLQARMGHACVGRKFAQLRHDDAQWQYRENKQHVRALQASLLIKRRQQHAAAAAAAGACRP